MYLESPNEKGKFLSVDLLGNVSFADRETGGAKSAIDQVWNIIEISGVNGGGVDGFLLVSELYKMALNYDPERHGEKIHGKLFTGATEGHTLWSFSDDKEMENSLYTIDANGDRRYLWSLTGNVYVTPDEHIAESWTPVSLEGYDVGGRGSGGEGGDQGNIFVMVWFVLFVAVLYMLFLRRM
jgi:hypothetical protein